MRAMPLIALVVSFGLVLGIFGALGVTDMLNGPETTIDGEVEDVADESEDQEIDPDEAGEGGFISFTLSGLGAILSIFHVALFLPSTLTTLGMPWPVARILGHGIQIVVSLGIIQVVIGDEVR